jgi:hypothetical protein
LQTLWHRLENFGVPPLLAFMSWLSHLPALQVFGAVISGGWLILGCVRERRQWLNRKDYKDESAGK